MLDVMAPLVFHLGLQPSGEASDDLLVAVACEEVRSDFS
jgi:hypothetical protein